MNFFRRRKFITNKKFQSSLLIISFSYIAFFFVVTGSSLFVPVMIDMLKANDPSGNALQSARYLLYLNDYFWTPVFLALIIIGLHSIYTSHKIAGPFYRLNLIFNAMKEGILPKPLHPRRKDYLLTEIELINQALENLREKIAEIQDARVQLSEAIFECGELGRHDSKDEIMKRIKVLREKGDQLGDKLDYFKISS